MSPFENPPGKRPAAFREEDFPLYPILRDLDNPGAAAIRRDFAAVAAGGDEERYNFALGIQTVAANVPAAAIPGVTEAINRKTLQSCLVLFKDIASRGHKNAAFMVQDFKRRNLGGPA